MQNTYVEEITCEIPQQTDSNVLIIHKFENMAGIRVEKPDPFFHHSQIKK